MPNFVAGRSENTVSLMPFADCLEPFCHLFSYILIYFIITEGYEAK
jgi:hypothetical protein